MKVQVLVVDDNDAYRCLLKNILEDQGWDVCEAENGKVALEQVRINPPDLIVSDILMPVMDGYALCREIKLDKDLKNIPFVIFSGTYTENKDKNFSLNLGADRFIVKPAETDFLIKTLTDLLQEKRGAHAADPCFLGETVFFKQHNDLMIRKLEKKMSELKKANQDLKEMEDTYRLSFENAGDVIFMVDTDYRISGISPSVEKILGYHPRDFLGRPVLELAAQMTPKCAELARKTIQNIFQGETIPATIYEFVARDGGIKIGEVSGSPILRNGRVAGMVSVARDVTDRHQAEKKLSISEKKFSDIFQLNPNPMAISDVEASTYLDVNQAFTVWTGLSREAILGVSSLDINVWVDSADRNKLIEKMKLSGEINNEEVMFRRKNGDIRYVLLSGRLIEIDGKICLLSLLNDITERKQAEVAMRESEKRYKFITDKIPDVVWMLDMNLQTVYVSPSIRNVLGFTEEERMHQSVNDQLTPESLALVADAMTQELKLEEEGNSNAERNVALNLEYYHKDGTTRWMETVAGGIRNEQDVLIGLHGVNRDITERKRAEDKLQRTLASLRKAIGATIQVMVSAVEARDPYTAGHQVRSADLARAIATEMGLLEDVIDGIRMAAAIHDIGKLSVPAEILVKPTRLTDLEFSLIKEHAQKGYDILKNVESPWPLAQIVYQHHERLDGTGYPRRLKGDDILLEARVLSVADVVEAIASHRPYRPAFGIEPALIEIEKNRGILYDSLVVDACLRLFRQKGYCLAQI